MSIYLSLPNKLNAEISSDSNLNIDKSVALLINAYIPGAKFLKAKPKKIDIKITHTESTARKMHRTGNHVRIYDNWSGKLPLDIYHLLYSVLRVNLIREGFYSVHSSCVGKKSYCLIVGHSGHGKTSVTLGLVNNGMKMLSNNKTIVSFGKDLTVVAGTTSVTVKGKSANGIAYGDRSVFVLDKNKYAYPNVKISSIFVVMINDKEKEFKKLEPTNALHVLYPYFLDAVNSDTIICNDVFVGNVLNAEEKLVKLLSQTLEKIPAYSISGTSKFIIKNILKI